MTHRQRYLKKMNLDTNESYLLFIDGDEKKYLTEKQRKNLNKGLKMAIIKKKKQMEKK